jgi:methyl-accepting chemotaxis protein
VAKNGDNIQSAAADATTSAGQLDQSSRSVNGLIKRSEDIVQRVSRQAEEGGQIIQKSILGISRVSAAMTHSATVMKELNKRTRDISGIVDTINVITERTNLLSLNASIEAARAGEAGRGFAVVAEEVRNLADRCAKATAEISEIVRGLEDATREATDAAGTAFQVAEESNRLSETGLAGLKTILAGITDSSALVTQISRAADEQIVVVRKVGESINATTVQAREIAISTAEQAKSAAQIVQAASQMRKGAKEVSQANSEQAKAAREVVKAAQLTTHSAGQIRKAMTEQAAGAVQIVQAIELMRKGAGTTTRSVAEQATAIELVFKETERLSVQFTGLGKNVAEQAKSCQEIKVAAKDFQQQMNQAGGAMKQQLKAVKEIRAGSVHVTRQIESITTANLEDSRSAVSILDRIRGIQATSKQSGDDAKSLQGLAGKGRVTKLSAKAGLAGRGRPANMPANFNHKVIL